MKILLLANQPESTTRLKLFRSTLDELGFTTVVPTFGTRNWLSIARQSRDWIIREQPDVVHLFNVPDIIYRKIPALKGKHFQKLIYDYRSPWGIEYQMNFGAPARVIAEHYERLLASHAEQITTVNNPLKEKVRTYANESVPVTVIPNYPKMDFSPGEEVIPDSSKPILFVGRVCKQEGIEKFIHAAQALPEHPFWIVGDGPFSWWYLRNKPENLTFFGWQKHEKVAEFIKNAGLCLIPRKENPLTPYSNDRSIWKLNEYLNLGKMVVASGISVEENRKNLQVVRPDDLVGTIRACANREPEPLTKGDYRFWEHNRNLIQEVYR